MNTVVHPPDALSAEQRAPGAAGAAPSSPAKARRWYSALTSDQALIALLILLAVICYGNTLFNAFVYDDEQQILQNPYVKSWHYLPQIFGSTVWSFVGAAGTTNYYRPLMTFTFLVLYQLFGDIPFGFHLFNITLNAAVMIMVFYAGRRLFHDRRVAFVAAVLFAVHPVHTEVVNWIAAVPELEVAFFVLLAFWLYLQLDRPSSKLYFATVAAFALALLSKEPALMFAPLALVFEHFVRDGHERTALLIKLKRYAPVCVAAAAYLLLRIALFGKLAPVLQHPQVTWPQAIYSAFALVAGHTKYLFWPAPLSAFHVFHASLSLGEPRVLAGICIFAIAAALILFLYKRAPQAAFCIFWMGIFIAPMLNARWMAANVFTERYLYLPSVGFCWLVAWCGMQLWDRRSAAQAVWPRALLVTAFAAIAVVAIVAVVRRNRVWRDDWSLYTRTLQTNPDAAVIRSNLGALYFDSEQFERALEEWQIALAQKPDNTVTMNALGIVYTRLGRYAEADAIFKRALAARPLWGDTHFNYAHLLQKTGHFPEALQEFKTAVELAPLSGAAHRWYGEALVENGQFDDAAVQLEQAVTLEDSLQSMQDLVNVYIRQGHFAQAEPLLRRIITRFPFDSSAHLLLAKVLEASGHRAEALREYQQVLSTDSANAEAKAAVQRLNR
ncbi:MAG TPA: tetratricopeptide repeat protein [Candidatus Acidoferrum sp.]|jgi:Tfp pilus assembly protein PilF